MLLLQVLVQLAQTALIQYLALLLLLGAVLVVDMVVQREPLAVMVVLAVVEVFAKRLAQVVAQAAAFAQQTQAATAVPSMEVAWEETQRLLRAPEAYAAMVRGTERLVSLGRGATLRTVSALLKEALPHRQSGVPCLSGL